jgi:short-subunit dehydrogenase
VRRFDSAFITGASSGIGRAMARSLSSQGTRVVVAARREPELRSLAEEIERAGGRADVCVLDVSDAQAVHDAVALWDEQTGGLELVVANAGMGITRPAHKLTWADVEPLVRINIAGAFATLVAAIGPMVTRGRGTLAGMSSIGGMRGLPTSAAYSASKAALSTFLESLRIDLQPRGVTVVDVRPSFVDTALTSRNKFKMPFLLQVEDAAERALRGIARGEAIVAFPWPMATAMRMAEGMPNALYRTLASSRSRRRTKR